MRQTHQHQIRQHLDVVMIVQTVLHVLQKLEYIDSVEARV